MGYRRHYRGQRSRLPLRADAAEQPARDPGPVGRHDSRRDPHRPGLTAAGADTGCRVDHLVHGDVCPRRLPAHRQQHALPVGLWRQRRGHVRARDVPGLLPGGWSSGWHDPRVCQRWIGCPQRGCERGNCGGARRVPAVIPQRPGELSRQSRRLEGSTGSPDREHQSSYPEAWGRAAEQQ